MPKVVLDTNVLIGVLLASQNCRDIRDAFLDGMFDVVISEALMAELLQTIRKPRLAKLFKAEDVCLKTFRKMPILAPQQFLKTL